MTQVLEEKKAHLANFTRLEKALANGATIPAWLAELRKESGL